MDITRNDDGTLLVPVASERLPVDESDEAGEHLEGGVGDQGGETEAVEDTGPATRLLHPGEGGYDEALAEWDRQQHGGEAATSTADGRQQAMGLVHAVAEDPDHDVADAVAGLDDPEASADALRHVLVGGVPSVEGFSAEVAESEGGEAIPAHQTTKIIGEILAELD